VGWELRIFPAVPPPHRHPAVVVPGADACVHQVSAGHSHSAAVTDTGALYVWGSGVSGKLGLGPITEEFECFAPVPYMLRFPESVSVRDPQSGAAARGGAGVARRTLQNSIAVLVGTRVMGGGCQLLAVGCTSVPSDM
jgi:hypothetical protein